MYNHDEEEKEAIPANDQQSGMPSGDTPNDECRALIVRQTDMIPVPDSNSQIPVEKLVLGVASAIAGGLLVRRLMRK